MPIDAFLILLHSIKFASIDYLLIYFEKPRRSGNLKTNYKRDIKLFCGY
jgi:hypothetical protein